MGDRTWPALLDQLIGREDLTDDRHGVGDGPGLSGEAHPGPARRVPGRAARQGRDAPPRSPGSPRRCCGTPAGSTVDGPRGRRRRHRRRPGRHGEHLDDGRGRRRRGRGAGGQARQPGGVVASAARPTCWRRSVWRSTCRRTASPRASPSVGIGFCFAPVFHPAMRHAGRAAPRARRPDGDERARPADQPGPAAGRPGRLRRRAAGPGDRRGVRRARGVGARGARRRRARRAHHHDHDHGLGGRRRRGAAGDRSTRPRSASRPPPARTCAAATPRTTPRSFRALRRAAATGPVRDAVLLNAAGALVAFDRPRRRADAAVRRPPRRARPRRGRHRLRRGRAPARPLGGALERPEAADAVASEGFTPRKQGLAPSSGVGCQVTLSAT